MNTLLRRFLLSVALLLCCTALANAAIHNAIKIDEIYYILNDVNNTATVTWGGEDSHRCTEGYSGDIVIPEKITYFRIDFTVTSIGKNAFEGCRLTSITIPSSVTSIGESAFKGSSLTSITIPSSVTSIGHRAFYNCSNLTSITIPSSVTSIGHRAFYNCSNLTSITIPSSVTSIGESAFDGCSGLTSITIPNSVTSIGNDAFAECRNLMSVYVSWKAPLAISDNVFSGLRTSKITLHVPDGTLDAYSTAYVWETFDLDGFVHFADANAEVISIENWDSNHDGLLSTKEAAAVTDLGDAFSNSTITSLNELKYFKNLTSIGKNAFSGCSMLKSINIPNRVTSIESGAFNGSAITSIEIPATITSIGESAFENCTNLKAVTIPATVTSIGENAFKGCSGLEEIYVKVQSPLPISSNVFENVATTCLLRVPYGSVKSYQKADVWKSFSNIQDNAIQFEDPEVKAICLANWDTNKDGVLTYEEAAAVRDLNSVFENNTTITSFNELKYFTGITTMWRDFSGCTNLKEITIPNGVTSIKSYTFQNCTNLVSITIPNSVAYIEIYAFDGCTNLQNIGINIVDFANNNIIYDYFGTSKTIKYYYNGEEISGELTIPNTTASIGNNALKGVTGLTSVTIPNSVTSIGSNAFEGCTGLTSVTIPNSVTSIGSNAFYGCTGLTSVTIPNSVTSIGSNAFEGCTELETVSVQWTEADKIPDISGKLVFNEITLANVSLDIPYKKGNIRPLYAAKDVWKDFNIVFAKNFIITKSDNTTIEHKASENSEIVIDESGKDIKNISVYDNAPSVKSITYTRDFTNVVGKWQAWFVPFEAPVSVLNDASIDAAEIAGILLDDEGETIVAFKKIEGDSKKMHANTPYVVRMGNDAPTIATLVFENTNLKETAESEYYAMSMYDKFTFTGNYESKAVANSYALNTEGEFQKMANDAVLGPMRFSLAVTPRDDSPYGSSSMNPTPRPKISYMILGDDSSLQPIDGDLQQDDEKTMRAMTPAISLKPRPQQTFIYDLRGRKVNRIQSKQVYIINGKNYIAR